MEIYQNLLTQKHTNAIYYTTAHLSKIYETQMQRPVIIPCTVSLFQLGFLNALFFV